MAADSPPTPKLDMEDSDETKPEAQASKRRKVVHKTVVRVKMEANVGKQKNEGPPSDFWSWRKYGQKPIKGSPYPRGYYRCSTSKGCSAKKQVERCKTEASVLVITYTSTHNHPGPDFHSLNPTIQPSEADDDDPGETTIAASPAVSAREEEPEQDREQERHLDRDRPTRVASIDEEDHAREDPFHYLRSPTNCSSQDLVMEQEHTLALQLHVFEEPLVPRSRYDNDDPSAATAAAALPREPEEGHDVFDELEELPAFSHFVNLKRSNCFFDDWIPVVPS
ncbi:probable WRKY transcription factor 65 [Rhodamnia argentea]|uniref:Probable WRKY transcription factor 65 n=1 Tax=Rhodamnia argentea TaxID=178133 RepID=A0A8B8QAP3_9MYRT|nr:probable WRKY transcription factor 65 [Rhodamnia argentea]